MSSETDIPASDVPADWDRVTAVHRQCLDAIADGTDSYLPDLLTGFLAEIISRVSASYYGKAEVFVNDALKAFNESSADSVDLSKQELYADARFRQMDDYSVGLRDKRRRPTPFEAVVETARRLRDLEAIQTILEPQLTIGAVLGGSTSYGRFFNVLGASGDPSKPSDIDMLVVIETFEQLEDVLKKFTSLPGVHTPSIMKLGERVEEFLGSEEVEKTELKVFSGKLDLWSDDSDRILSEIEVSHGYHLSLHFVDPSVMSRLILKGMSKILSTSKEFTIFDFRELTPSRSDHQRSFTGSNLQLEIQFKQIETSYLRETKALYIDEDDRYFPGMFQNLILPQFDVRWGTPQFRRDIEAFRWKLVERLRFERRMRPDELMRISLSHTRSEIFAPHVIRSVDSTTFLS